MKYIIGLVAYTLILSYFMQYNVTIAAAMILVTLVYAFNDS